jgi:hypothetical protein
MPMQAWLGDAGVQQASFWQTSGAAHVFGHWTIPPQPSGAVPQTTP